MAEVRPDVSNPVAPPDSAKAPHRGTQAHMGMTATDRQNRQSYMNKFDSSGRGQLDELEKMMMK